VVTDLVVVGAACAVTAVLTMTVTAWTARRAGRISVVDTAWGIGLTLIALVSALVGTALDEGDGVRRWVLVALVAIWGLRLSWHMHARNAGKGEDQRYREMLEGTTPAQRIVKVWVMQGAALLLVSLPVQVAAVADGAMGWIAWAGIAVCVVGVLFEAVGDAQLARFKADPANQGRIMDRGLWSWTRHPNYFGDATVWWGIWLVSVTAWWSLLTLPAPITMTYFLVFATGAKLLERHMRGRPGWDEYVARTSMFVPLPPRDRGHTVSR
jgi:steroid 5-alpha reductase family enzyme